MWKDSYIIGVDIVDEQHKQLFQMVDGLVKVVRDKKDWEAKKPLCKKSITFLKDYVVMHFKAEEGYQASIQYSGAAEHKKLHQKFTNEVLEYEKKLIETDFDRDIVKRLVGMLTTWLIYHIADEDQRFASGKQSADPVKEKTMMQCFLMSIAEILGRMTGMEASQLSGSSVDAASQFGDVFVKVGIIGEIRGSILYGYSKEFALNMMKTMTMAEIEEIDEMVYSAMAELSNIISGNGTMALYGKGYECDITIPEVTAQENLNDGEELKAKIQVHTPFGDLTLGTTFLG